MLSSIKWFTGGIHVKSHWSAGVVSINLEANLKAKGFKSVLNEKASLWNIIIADQLGWEVVRRGRYRQVADWQQNSWCQNKISGHSQAVHFSSPQKLFHPISKLDFSGRYYFCCRSTQNQPFGQETADKLFAKHRPKTTSNKRVHLAKCSGLYRILLFPLS